MTQNEFAQKAKRLCAKLLADRYKWDDENAICKRLYGIYNRIEGRYIAHFAIDVWAGILTVTQDNDNGLTAGLYELRQVMKESDSDGGYCQSPVPLQSDKRH